jgi:hypothetical protein
VAPEASAEEGTAEYVPFEDFRAGLPAGRFRVIVDPKRARRYIAQRFLLLLVTLPVIGTGIGMALMGHTGIGALLVVLGVAVNRLLAWQAPGLLLHLASRDPTTYHFATQNGLMEVQRRG